MYNTQFLRIVRKAKNLFHKDSESAVSLFREAEKLLDIDDEILPRDDEATKLRSYTVSDEKYQEEINYTRARFWGDYMGALCNCGYFYEALQASEKAFYHMDVSNAKPLLYLLYNTGNIYLFSGDYQTAIEWYDKAIYENEVNKRWLNEHEKADYYSNKATALYFLERYDEAEEWYLRSIQQGKKNFEPFYFLSDIYKRKEDLKLYNKYRKMYQTRRDKISDDDFERCIRFYPIRIE